MSVTCGRTGGFLQNQDSNPHLTAHSSTLEDGGLEEGMMEVEEG